VKSFHVSEELIAVALAASQAAEVKILSFYKKSFSSEIKADNSPVTQADIAADNAIRMVLSDSGLPMYSEESSPEQENSKEETYWLVDPIDGTEEFIAETGEFTINIALIHAGEPVLGVMGVPAPENLLRGHWLGVPERGLFMRRGENSWELAQKVLKSNNSLPGILASRRDLRGGAGEWLNKQFQDSAQYELMKVGSSLKFLYLALNMAELYPRSSRLNAWDVATGIALLQSSGGRFQQLHKGERISIAHPRMSVPPFIAISSGYKGAGQQ
jgi:3'(2'), 5'-bisphosphate nucleotidase